MTTAKSLVRIGTLCAVLFSGAAHADTTVWEDPVQGFTMSYPDSWRVQTEDAPSTRLRVASPVGQDIVTCRMQVWDDGRTATRVMPRRCACISCRTRARAKKSP